VGRRVSYEDQRRADTQDLANRTAEFRQRNQDRYINGRPPRQQQQAPMGNQGAGGVTVSTPEQTQNQDRMLTQYGREGVMQGQAQERERANQEFMKPSADALAYQAEMAEAKRAYQAGRQPVANPNAQRAGAPPPPQPQEPKPAWEQMYDRAANYFNYLR